MTIPALLNLVTLTLILAGCQQAGQKAYPVAAQRHEWAGEALPAASNPSEALKQLLEGNARYARQERRWEKATLRTGYRRPFALVVNMAANQIPAEVLFDQPSGTLEELSWERKAIGCRKLEEALQSGVRIVCVLVGGPAKGQNVHLQPRLRALEATLRNHCLAMTRALENGACRIVGAVVDPVSGRVALVPEAAY